MYRILTVLLCACLIAAHLLVPQRLLSYSPCCYDAQGRLTVWRPARSEQRGCCGMEGVSTRPSCCEPREQILRSNPPSDLNSAEATPAFGGGWSDSLPSPAYAPATLSSPVPSPLGRFNTGPPEGIGWNITCVRFTI